MATTTYRDARPHTQASKALSALLGPGGNYNRGKVTGGRSKGLSDFDRKRLNCKAEAAARRLTIQGKPVHIASVSRDGKTLEVTHAGRGGNYATRTYGKAAAKRTTRAKGKVAPKRKAAAKRAAAAKVPAAAQTLARILGPDDRVTDRGLVIDAKTSPLANTKRGADTKALNARVVAAMKALKVGPNGGQATDAYREGEYLVTERNTYDAELRKTYKTGTAPRKQNGKKGQPYTYTDLKNTPGYLALSRKISRIKSKGGMYFMDTYARIENINGLYNAVLTDENNSKRSIDINKATDTSLGVDMYNFQYKRNV